MKIEKDKYLISKLKKLAMDNLENTTTEDKIRKDDVTELLEHELFDKLKYKELINMQIIGQVTTGKSTLGIEYMLKVNEWLKKKSSMHNICYDQIEYIRRMRDKTLNEVCLLIDEWNEMGETGFNATTENAQINYYSDIQAQRYIHRISCAPKNITDQNADIVLEVLSANKKERTTAFLVHYRLVKPYEVVLQLCGHANIEVENALDCSFYKSYRVKKFAKMDFMIENGIKDVREIYQAKVILQVFEELQYTAKVMNVTRDIIVNFVEKIRREERDVYSILAMEDVIRKAQGLLALHREIYKLSQKEHALEKAKKIDLELITDIKRNKHQLTKTRDAIIEDYKKLITLGAKYEKI